MDRVIRGGIRLTIGVIIPYGGKLGPLFIIHIITGRCTVITVITITELLITVVTMRIIIIMDKDQRLLMCGRAKATGFITNVRGLTAKTLNVAEDIMLCRLMERG